jgi:hypothetical protein
MSARKKKPAKRPAKRKSAVPDQRSPFATRAQQRARGRIIANSGVTITKEMLDELRRELRALED